MTTRTKPVQELIRCIHMAQWTPGRRCVLSRSEWDAVSDADRAYLERLAVLSGITIELTPQESGEG